MPILNTNKGSILHIIDTTGPGGAETVFLNLAEKDVLKGYKNIALIKGSGWVEQQLKKRGINYFILHPYGFLSIPYYLDLIQLLKKNQVALVQAHLLGSILTSSIVCIICQIPLVATLHGQVDINPQEKFVLIKRWLMSVGVSQLITVSQSLSEYINNLGLFQRKKIKVIYNGVDTSRYNQPARSELRKKLNLNHNTILVGSLGNIRPAKNYELLVEAAAMIKKTKGYNTVHFLIAGHQPSDLMIKLNALADKLDVTKMVHFLGFLDDTPKFLSELNIFLLCSSSEGFSIATIEAMIAGVPVIATRCGGPEEIINDGCNGILIEKNNPIAIAENITFLIENKKHAAMLSKAGKEHIISKFSMEIMIKRYKTVYRQLLEKSSIQI